MDAQPGWQVLLLASPLARPLIEEVLRLLARRGARVLLRLTYGMEELPFEDIFAAEAPEDLLTEAAPIDRAIWAGIDAWMRIGAPENVRDGSELPSERAAALARSRRPALELRLKHEIAWVTCRYPTPAFAQQAGMPTREFADFLYGACLLDWDEEGRRMQRIVERFDAVDEVRIVGHETDLTLSLAGRRGLVDDGRENMPGGEVFFSPVEDSAEGVITYSEFPAVQEPDIVEGVRLVFRAGRVVDASASHGEEVLLRKLDTDEGARRLGELGIGCNPRIQRHIRNTLFDEKIAGTVHLAIGAGMPAIGGVNESSVHWDMVKDLRRGGRLYADGELVQENGEWRF